MPQIAAEELGIGVDKIKYVEGDTALTPDQGRTSGSNGIQRRRHADPPGRRDRAQGPDRPRRAEAQRARRTTSPPPTAWCGPKAGGQGVSFAELIAGKNFNLKLDPKAPLKNPAELHVGRQAAAAAGRAGQMHRAAHLHAGLLACPNMLHGRVIRPPAIGASLVSVDESSVAGSARREGRARSRISSPSPREDEWTAIKAARALKAQWSDGTGAARASQLDGRAAQRAGHDRRRRWSTKASRARSFRPTPRRSRRPISGRCRATPRWGRPAPSPTCDGERATIWTASQGTHGNQTTMARVLEAAAGQGAR